MISAFYLIPCALLAFGLAGLLERRLYQKKLVLSEQEHKNEIHELKMVINDKNATIIKLKSDPPVSRKVSVFQK